MKEEINKAIITGNWDTVKEMVSYDVREWVEEKACDEDGDFKVIDDNIDYGEYMLFLNGDYDCESTTIYSHDYDQPNERKIDYSYDLDVDLYAEDNEEIIITFNFDGNGTV